MTHIDDGSRCHWGTGNRLDGSSARIDPTGVESLLEPTDSQRTTNPGGH